jgi:hypothetical protein
MYANMAKPTVGTKMEKIIVGIPNTAAAAGEIKADSILNSVPPLYLYLHRFNCILPVAFIPRELAYHDYGLQAIVLPVQRFNVQGFRG